MKHKYYTAIKSTWCQSVTARVVTKGLNNNGIAGHGQISRPLLLLLSSGTNERLENRERRLPSY